MNLTTSTHNGWHAIHVDGQVDSKTVGTLRDYIDNGVTGSLPVALDLTAVPFMSSAGLRTLLPCTVAPSSWRWIWPWWAFPMPSPKP